MTIHIDTAMSWDKLRNRYASENIHHKDKARQLLVNALGFEPNIEKSIDAELILRNSLQKIDDGHLDNDTFKLQVTLLVETVSRMTSRHNR